MTAPERVYAIGDVHGRLNALREVHAAIDADLASRPATHAVVHIGDYVDRGEDSKGVIDHLIAGRVAGAPWVFLKGNHDRMFSRFLASPGGRDERLRPELHWLHDRLGGAATLRSYGIDVADGVGWEEAPRLHALAAVAVPAAHVAFLDGLVLSHAWRDVFFAHAGIAPGVPLAEQTEDDLIWIRGPFHDSDADHGALIVHGHTPVRKVEDHGNRIAIDTGAAYGGPLSCVVFETGGQIAVLGGERFR